MKKSFLSFSVLSLLSICTFSQGERNIWYFGNMAGLDFNGGPPVALTNGALFTYDNCTSVSNGAGNLLFYSNGVTVWNSNHVPMPNGTGLLGHNSSTNAAFGVKQPGSNNNYYLFTDDQFAGSNGVRYSIIDMSLQSGLGDVTGTKNVLLQSPSTEKILAVKHSNNIDIWIIVHPWNSNSFNAYLLSATGLNTTPVVSSVGSVHTGGTSGTYNSMGQISASPSGNKIACAIYDLQVYEMFDFNAATGSLSNLISISTYPNAWGVEFSPDGTKLYTTQWMFSSIYQFDISSNNQTTINSSATVIGTATSPDPTYKAGFLQLGPDNKIYVAKFTSTDLGTISNPNISGTGCNYIDNGVSLNGKMSEAGLPAFLKTGTSKSSVNENENILSFSISPNPSNGIFVIKSEEEVLSIEIYNVLGAKIFDQQISKSSNFQINLSSQSKGIYFVKVQSGEKISTQKIIIQ